MYQEGSPALLEPEAQEATNKVAANKTFLIKLFENIFAVAFAGIDTSRSGASFGARLRFFLRPVFAATAGGKQN